MASCIYCGSPADSAEHWLPRAFGAVKGLAQLKNRLCDGCNREMGRDLDQEVANTGLTGFLKSALDIEGRHNTPPKNPFLYKVMGKESATTMLMDCPNGPYKILGQMFKTETGETHVIALRQLVFKKSNGEMVPVQFPPAYDGQRLKALMKERGVEDATLEAIYLDDESLDNIHVRRVLTDALGNFSCIAYGGIGDSGGRQNVLVSAGISRKYLRGIAKIGFHHYLAMSSAHTGSELLFQPIRRFIRYGEGDYENFITLTIDQFIGPLREGKAPASFGHFLGYHKQHGHVVSLVQFFVGPNHVPPPSRVVLGLTNKDITRRLDWVSYYGEKVDGYDGEIKDLTPCVTPVSPS